MLQYASADLIGCTVINERGVMRSRPWRAMHTENVNTSKRANGNLPATPANWLTAALIICTDTDTRTFQRALFALRSEGKRETTSKLALMIQKIERANARTTNRPDTEDRAERGEYDGFVMTRAEREAELYNLRELEVESEWHTFNWSQARGILHRGRKDNIKRLPAIPSARLCKIDPTFIPIRATLMRERELNLQFGVSHVKYGPAF